MAIFLNCNINNIFHHLKIHPLQKKIRIAYWIVTGLFAAFMLFSAIPDIMVVPDAVTMVTGLGYPKYLIRFLGVAKLLGVIAMLVPGFHRLKEWAYAGLFSTWWALHIPPLPRMDCRWR